LTTIELLTAVVIMGLVVAPLSIAMTQALNLVPESSERTKASTDTDRLLRDFSNDVANANDHPVLGRVANFATIPFVKDRGTGQVACPTTASAPIPQNLLIWAAWMDRASIAPVQKGALYILSWSRVSADLVKVELLRMNELSQSDVYLTGYCQSSPTADPVATVTITPPGKATRERVELTLNLRNRNGDPQQPLVLAGTVRAS
jgi:hypothetical protein